MLVSGAQQSASNFYTLQNDHHDKSRYKAITILLTIFPMLYISSL